LIFREAEDRDLVARAQRGHVDAYNTLVSRWEKRLYNYLLRMTGNAEDAFDLSQETFLKAYQNLRKLEDVGRFGPWVFRIAHNEAISLHRRSRPETELSDAVLASPSQRLAPVEVSLAIESALGRLTNEQREAVLLKVYQGFKFEEIAEILGCPASTIKSRVYTALELLQEILAPLESRRLEEQA
jgi:RNA polymerase sigma-70 factor, ECF subfamily